MFQLRKTILFHTGLKLLAGYTPGHWWKALKMMCFEPLFARPGVFLLRFVHFRTQAGVYSKSTTQLWLGVLREICPISFRGTFCSSPPTAFWIFGWKVVGTSLPPPISPELVDRTSQKSVPPLPQTREDERPKDTGFFFAVAELSFTYHACYNSNTSLPGVPDRYPSTDAPRQVRSGTTYCTDKQKGAKLRQVSWCSCHTDIGSPQDNLSPVPAAPRIWESFKINVPGKFSIFEGPTPSPPPHSHPPNENVPPKKHRFYTGFSECDI